VPPIGHRLPLPFALLGVARPAPARAATTGTTNDDSLWMARRETSSTCLSCWCATRVCRAPAARRLTEGRSLPGDSTLVCAAYHQFPLILNRIQRTKPAPGHPTAAARCVHRYRSARARRISGVSLFSRVYELLTVGVKRGINFFLVKKFNFIFSSKFNFLFLTFLILNFKYLFN